jgi:thioredoxin reductase (NADPH)
VLGSGADAHFDTLYPMQGSSAHCELAVCLGAQRTDGGDIVVDAHQQTSVPGLYAIGDVVNALNQISVGLGHAAIAATAVHNRLPDNLR